MNARSSIIAFALAAAAAGYAQAPTYYYNGKQRVEIDVVSDAVSTTNALELARAGIATPAPMAVLRPKGAASDRSDMTVTLRVSFKLKPGVALADVQGRYGLTDAKAVKFLPDVFTAGVSSKSTSTLATVNTANTMQETGSVEWATPVVARQRYPRWVPNDTYFNNQWSLRNLGTNTVAGVAGNDLQMVPTWDLANGMGINIVIADQGVQTTHADLAANCRTDIDWDFNSNDADPTPSPSTHNHGSSCAGIAAAVANNSAGIAGIAHKAGIVGIRLIALANTDQQEADSLLWKAFEINSDNLVSVNSNSWGPDDDGIRYEGPGPIAEAALETGATLGRNGKGVVYMWAAGNGGQASDNVNRDGYANSPYVIAVGATDSAGSVTFYSERGAAILVNTPSGDSNGDNIYTTTNASYTSGFNGTSASTPAAAGVVALMLQVNPNLTYRDVMHILVKTAVKNAPGESSWITNGAGLHFSHYYGFGRVNAFAAVTSASTWVNKPASATPLSASYNPEFPLTIPDNNAAGVQVPLTISGSSGFSAEHVELTANITHSYRGDLAIRLVSPSGTESELVHAKSSDGVDNISHWKFRTVANWDENPNGTWVVKVSDGLADDTGVINSLTLKVIGHLKDPGSSVDSWPLY